MYILITGYHIGIMVAQHFSRLNAANKTHAAQKAFSPIDCNTKKKLNLLKGFQKKLKVFRMLSKLLCWFPMKSKHKIFPINQINQIKVNYCCPLQFFPDYKNHNKNFKLSLEMYT